MVDDTAPQVLRRARSYAPDPILLPFRAREVLACGAELKNTFCMTKDDYAFLSQHIGDLDNLETLTHYEHVLTHYRKFFRLSPTIVAHDKHPDYLSTRFAQDLKIRDNSVTLVPVQHHHAHIVSCMVDNDLEPPVLGVAFDGTGYGEDGHIWGGEFLLVEYGKCKRLGHLEEVPLPGGEGAIKKPYRMAMSYLLTLLGEEALRAKLPFLKRVSRVEQELICIQLKKAINTPLTSSAGRLFDAVSALLDIRSEVDYEGQAAIELEMMATEEREPEETYPFEIAEEDGLRMVRLREVFSHILADLARGRPRVEIAVTFHHTIAKVIDHVCQAIARDTGIRQVALSGGVFQNRLLLKLSRRRLINAGLTVLTHKGVPCNDGGISLGQAVIAHFMMNQTQVQQKE